MWGSRALNRMRYRGARCTPPALCNPRRGFQVIQRGHDRQQESLYDKLGFDKDTEARRVRRIPSELRQALLRRVEELRDPTGDPADVKRLADLREAYAKLQDDNFRASYAAHFYASNDARLHVLCDGGQIAANFNAEHQQFTYVDHAIDRDGGGATEGERFQSGSGLRLADMHPSKVGEMPTADAMRDAFVNASGVGLGPTGETSSTATAYNSADAAGPLHGADVTHLLRISLAESLSGCEAAVTIEKNVRCDTCRGHGRQRLRTPRKCPQCLGRGSAHLPSATYHIERRCLYCGGEGTVPAPPCRVCSGRGVHLHQLVTVPVTVPAGTLTSTLFRIRHHGHDGVRGGRTGDALITVMVSEHRYFYRSTENSHVLHAMLPIPLSVALLGGRVTVPTVSGQGEIHVPPCVRNGQVLPLNLYGVSDADRSYSHSLLYHILVMIPRVEELSGRQKEALQNYEEGHASVGVSVSRNGSSNEDVVDGEAAVPSASPSAPSVALQRASRAQLMEECAALKSTYQHWFTSS